MFCCIADNRQKDQTNPSGGNLTGSCNRVDCSDSAKFEYETNKRTTVDQPFCYESNKHSDDQQQDDATDFVNLWDFFVVFVSLVHDFLVLLLDAGALDLGAAGRLGLSKDAMAADAAHAICGREVVRMFVIEVRVSVEPALGLALESNSGLKNVLKLRQCQAGSKESTAKTYDKVGNIDEQNEDAF
jgi:hypothetical protein